MKLLYFKDIPNFGDLLNENILKEILGIKEIIHTDDISVADMIAIGSMLDRNIYKDQKQISLLNRAKRLKNKYRLPKLKIFGTGFIRPPMYSESLIRRVDIMALRGKLSLERMQQLTHSNLTNTPLGDPGLLSNLLVKSTEKNYSLGIIPHFIDKDNPYIKFLNENIPNSTILDIQDHPKKFLKKIAECDYVISSAMHGLIAADSLGIPNCRMVLSDKIVGGDYKFNDYYSVFELEDAPLKIVLNENNARITVNNLLNNISDRYKIKAKQILAIQDNLINAFKEK